MSACVHFASLALHTTAAFEGDTSWKDVIVLAVCERYRGKEAPKPIATRRHVEAHSWYRSQLYRRCDLPLHGHTRSESAIPLRSPSRFRYDVWLLGNEQST